MLIPNQEEGQADTTAVDNSASGHGAAALPVVSQIATAQTYVPIV
jgi:hypothetical protein